MTGYEYKRLIIDELNFDNLTKEELEQLNALVEKASKPKRKIWKPEIGEDYFAIEPSEWIENRIVNYCVDSDYDNFNMTIGNCFKTREEAEFALEKLKVIAEMKRYITEHDNVELDWNDNNQEKWYIIYDYNYSSIDTEYYMHSQSVDKSLYASSPDLLENMVEDIGEDRIKKYYFGVE